MIQSTNVINKMKNHLSNHQSIILRSTVYPGTTEEVCIPIIEKQSNKKHNSQNFYDDSSHITK